MKNPTLKISLLIILISVVFAASAQRPFINSIDPKVAPAGSKMVITGSGFPGTIAEIQVNIGAGVATVTNLTGTLIEVDIPANATYGAVTVLNKTSDLIGTSSDLFLPSYEGAGFNIASFDAIQENKLPGQRFVNDLCTCDFDGDGLNDVALTAANKEGSENPRRNVYRNSSANTGPASFSKVLELANNNNPSLNANCGDLNGDGLPELIFSELTVDNTDEQIEIFTNTSTVGNIAFNATPTLLTFPTAGDGTRRSPTQIEVADVDGDGRHDLIVGTNTDNDFDIFLNNGTGGTISFAASPTQVRITNGNTNNLKVIDLNSDGLPEVIVGSLLQTNSFIIFENLSIQGSPVFGPPISVSSSSTAFQGIAVGDFDNDGLLDIAVTNGQSGANEIRLFRNISTAGSITFGAAQRVALGNNGPLGIDAGDIDGDGKLDLVVGIGNRVDNRVEILINNTTSSTFDFSLNELTLNDNSRNINISDVNNDGKPDILMTTASAINEITNGALGIIINRNCFKPQITPTTGTFCTGVSPFVLESTSGIGVTYDWQVSTDGGSNFSSLQSGTSATFDLASQGIGAGLTAQVKVLATSADNQCVGIESNTVTIAPNTIAPPSSSIQPVTPFCEGDDLVLTTTVTADIYTWEGPNRFSQTINGTSGQSITISNAEPVNAGTYSLTVENIGGCSGVKAERLVEISNPPIVEIFNEGDAIFCDGGSAQLRTQDYSSTTGISYQWTRDGANVGTGPSLLAQESGDYVVTITDANTCQNASETLTLVEATPPSSSFTAATETCVNAPLRLSSTSTGFDTLDLGYTWEFLDNSNAVIGTITGRADTAFTFTTAGAYTARLTTTYPDVSSCQDIATQAITVTEVPDLTISTPEGIEKCPSDSILLQLPSTFQSFSWSTGDTTSSTFAKTAIDETQVDVSVTAVNEIGCELSSMITVTNFVGSGISISSPDAEVIDGILTIPDVVNILTLEAVGVVSGAQWMPSNIFSNDTALSVRVFPRSSSTEITLEGRDSNDCDESTSITLINNLVRPRKTFSPNGDGIGFECWEIQNTSALNGCTVYIFDAKGRNILETQSPFADDCVWDGNANGTSVPEGIYYFAMKCEDSQFDQTGSILLGR
ncbi:MAG: VCBS repeat-containing protein [Cyclobacteriaceae bacterium]|nr:VCBS repeat-containing protein [Cyclobacteriaceae bacterium HetDA_MAG_MS6]